jgi:hypothetical protein
MTTSTIILSQEAMRVLVMEKPATSNNPSEGSSTWGLETFMKLGTSMPKKLAPRGPKTKPTTKKAKIMTREKTIILVAQPSFGTVLFLVFV